MDGESLIVQDSACYVDQVTMMRKEQYLPALGESGQCPQNIGCSFIVRGNKHVVEHERHVWVLDRPGR